jgi:hypothetical protein
MTGAMETELLSSALAPIVLGELVFDSGTVRVWTGTRDLTFDGEVFFGGGTLLNVAITDETLELRAAGLSVSMSGIPSSLLSIALAEDFQGRDATFWLGVINVSGVLVADPVVSFKGLMDVMSIEEGPSISTISIAIENELVSLQRPSERAYNDVEQQLDFPGDLGFEFATRLYDGQEIRWGL